MNRFLVRLVRVLLLLSLAIPGLYLSDRLSTTAEPVLYGVIAMTAMLAVMFYLLERYLPVPRKQRHGR